MNSNKILDALADPKGQFNDDYQYGLEVAQHLEPALGSWLTTDECVSLMYLLTFHSIRYNDGFMINDSNHTIGFIDGAAISSAFHKDEGVDTDAIYRLHMQNNSNPLYLEIMKRLLDKIIVHGNVIMVTP